ncbi:RNA 2'-phosphotransferase [Rubripirellula lacrimiformis]|uniref:RNA 2'-phosphotransferase n=1 Tax=Rubripirellula lacrimiformis TaxID=1930273 RepID=A0A517NEE4_9BACT|nr:RNA 2'-phosphotransferase [Rubripirellula lacrimiformis]QDT05505.1 RNA 2'-phosphotransferase [Rubripirellula lacrimiformis]
MNKRLTKISKYMAFILRHEPQSIGIQLDESGFVEIDLLVRNANATGKSITADQVRQVVAAHEGKMFAISEDGTRVRAC